jgi:uracil phosphoribosyltransferase
MIRLVGSVPSVANHFLSELRDEAVQKDRMRFRRNLERLGEIMAVEISKTLPYRPEEVITPLGKTTIQKLVSPPVLVAILRAGLPYFQGFQNYFDQADSGFIGAYRQEGSALTVKLDYLATPTLTGRTVILIDPMLATGTSVTDALRVLQRIPPLKYTFLADV